jgi:hypothetical protein
VPPGLRTVNSALPALLGHRLNGQILEQDFLDSARVVVNGEGGWELAGWYQRFHDVGRGMPPRHDRPTHHRPDPAAANPITEPAPGAQRYLNGNTTRVWSSSGGVVSGSFR